MHIIRLLGYKRQIHKKGRIVKNREVLCQLLKLKRELHINCTVPVIEYPEADSPMLIGFFHHILVLPTEQYDSEELFFILKHELIHLKRGDIYFKLLFVVANVAHWFNPLVWIMQKEAAVDMELSCDERVTKDTDYVTRKAYTETLLSTLHKQSSKKTVLSTQFYGGKQIMKKRFKNILAKKGKKNGIAVLICAIILTVSLGTLVGCSVTKENTNDGVDSLETENVPDESIQTDEPLPESDLDNNEDGSGNEPVVNQQESNAQMMESVNPETFPIGEYHDDMGSQLTISKVDDKNYTVTYGIYKLTYVENAVGSYDASSGILSFSGTDIATEIELSADITIQGDNLIVTLTHSEYPDCPAGTIFEFEPGQS